LEGGVSNSEHFVDEKNLRLEMRGDSEREAHVHAARVALDGSVDGLLDLGELDDRIELPRDLVLSHAEYRAREKNVLSSGKLGVKAGSNFEQRADSAIDISASAGRLSDAGKNLEKC